MESEALNLKAGKFGTTFNGQTYQVEAIASLGNWQFTTYVDQKGRVCVARRKWSDASWQRIAFDDYTINHDDVHNVPVLGICPTDGTIHLAFDHHNSPLHYRVSQPGAATAPEAVDWSPGLFGPITSELSDGVELDRLTYPIFVSTPDGVLQLYYRIGKSGNGDNYLAEYRPHEGWRVLGEFVTGRGVFVDSDSRSAYHNGFDYDAAGRLHTTWVWRESPNLLSNHDLQYAYSDDCGHTWRSNDGSQVGVSGQQPMDLRSQGITVRPIAYGWGLMNQVTQTVDGSGRVHVVLWQQPPSAPTASADLNTWRYVHYWREPTGAWHQQVLPCYGRKPSVVAHGDNLILVSTKPENLDYHGKDPGGPLQILTASAADNWGTWRELHRTGDTYVGEPRVDESRWRESAVLSVYVQRAPAEPGVPSALQVLDLDIGR
ncbi:BNR repeat-containing protein [Microlunatus sp. GCM10028923]|uniref:BNR repeat-containing protein n=1 Tax=Microlunatus sp. GCM10028923 TaxID=3273400 RepID=UPI0036122FA2